MRCVLGVWGGGGLKEVLEDEVLIFPGDKRRYFNKHFKKKQGFKKFTHFTQKKQKPMCLDKRCASPHPAVHTHTMVPGSRHQQHWTGGCVCGLLPRSPPSASLSPTPPSLSWLASGSFTSSLSDTEWQKAHTDGAPRGSRKENTQNKDSYIWTCWLTLS